MQIETLIYAYLAICCSMIVFNCVCVFVFRRRSRVLHRHSSHLEEQIRSQMDRLAAGESVEESHQMFLQKKLRSTGNLLAFDETMERLLERCPEEAWRYLREISSVFTYLAMENHYRSAMKTVYFAYIVKRYRIIEGKSIHVIMELMRKLLQEPSLYCRESALQAIYSSGDCAAVVQALQTVDESGRFHHAKLLTDGLLNFRGEQRELADALWRSFDSFSVPMRVVILDYIRFSGGEKHEELLQLLADRRQDDEVRFSCIRYFGRYPYEPAYPLLLSFAERAEDNRWEYAAIAATALSAYPGEHTVEVLKGALNSSNWYIRFNAAKSLESFHLSYLALSDVMEGNDRYAREILQYRLDMKNAREEEKEAAPV